MSVGLLWTHDQENERRQQTLLKRALELDLSTLWTTILWTLWVIYWVDLGDRAVRSEGRPGRQIIRRSKETGESDKRVVFPKMEIFPSFDLVVDPLYGMVWFEDSLLDLHQHQYLSSRYQREINIKSSSEHLSSNTRIYYQI